MFGESVTIPGPITTTSARTIARVKARVRIESPGMPDDSDGNECVFIFYFMDGECTDLACEAERDELACDLSSGLGWE